MMMIFPDDRFGRWLRTLRLQQSLSLEQLAEKVRCEMDLLLQLEEGHLLELDSQLCQRLFKALRIPSDATFPPDEI